MPLPKSIQRVADTIVAFHAKPVGDGPYQLYQYLPDQEYRVRRDLMDLKIWLEAKHINCVAISLADLFWNAIEESGRFHAIVASEKDGGPNGLEDAVGAVNSILKRSPSLADRVVAAVEGCSSRSAVFLYRAGALYPAIRTSGLLDELLGRVRLPVTLLYPGRLHGSFGLSFLDILPPHYTYRATIIPRGDDE
jgi:Domain of unknown function (DUF1788)